MEEILLELLFLYFISTKLGHLDNLTSVETSHSLYVRVAENYSLTNHQILTDHQP